MPDGDQENVAAHAAEAEALMVKMAATCVGSAMKAYGISLDYSVASLDGLESVLNEMHREHLGRPISDEGMYARCVGLGANRRSNAAGSGQDLARSSEYGENTFPLTLPTAGSVFPTSWCRKRIENGKATMLPSKRR